MASADGEEKAVKVWERWHRCSLLPQHSWLSGTCLLFPPGAHPSLPLPCILLPSPAFQTSSLAGAPHGEHTCSSSTVSSPALTQKCSGRASPGLQAMHGVMARVVSLYNHCANYSLMEKYQESLGELLPNRARCKRHSRIAGATLIAQVVLN